jgi:integrase/recombinase XerD
LTSTIAKTELGTRLDERIETLTSELSNTYTKNLLYASGENAFTIIDYINAMKIEDNYSPDYRKDTIGSLCRFSKYHNNKPFKDITRDNIIKFLNSLRKSEIEDPLNKWVGTYNLVKIYLLRFFRWLYSPNVNHKDRPKPSIMENIPKLKRKETSIYKPADIWRPADDLLFLKYCPNKRDRCYHAISRDLSCRPHEILKLKIRDVSFKNIGTAIYAEVVVSGKTTQRPIPLINSIPYLKDYLDHEHPQPGNPNAPLICGTGNKLGRHIDPSRIYQIYIDYQKIIFPKMLESPEVLPEDKPKIRELLKKRWNPYVRRHSALTEKSTILKEHVLRQHAGWKPNSNMHLKYLHYFGSESNESLLEAYGLVDHGVQIDQLRPKQCPNCQEGNKPDSKFCAKCRMVLTYDAYNETLENQKEREDDINALKQQVGGLISALGTMDESSKNEWAKRMVKSGIFTKDESAL